MAVIDSGSNSAGKANVSPNYELSVIGPKTYAAGGTDPQYDGGFFTAVAEIDSGTVTGSKYQKSIDITDGYRLRVGMDTPTFFDQFAGSTINTSLWTVVTSAAAAQQTVASGVSTLNASNLTTSGSYALQRTLRTFTSNGAFPLSAEWVAIYASGAYQSNCVVEMGFGVVTTTATPADGVFYRWNNAGLFQCVMSFGGTETVVNPASTPTINERHEYAIYIGNDAAEFWVDDVLYADIDIPAASPSATATQNLPWFARVNNTGIVPAAVQLRLAQVNIFMEDAQIGRTWAHTQVGQGLGAYQAPTGQTQGGTSNYAVSAAPALGTLANATPSYTTLGGQFLFAAPVAAETDMPLFGFLNPLNTAAIPGKNLFILGIHISAVNVGAIVATTPTVLQFAAGIGNSAASLATLTEGAYTAGAVNARFRRAVGLGYLSWPVGAAIGAISQNGDIVRTFDAPLMVEPGTYFHLMLKTVAGTATASQQIRGMASIIGYWD